MPGALDPSAAPQSLREPKVTRRYPHVAASPSVALAGSGTSHRNSPLSVVVILDLALPLFIGFQLAIGLGARSKFRPDQRRDPRRSLWKPVVVTGLLLVRMVRHSPVDVVDALG